MPGRLAKGAADGPREKHNAQRTIATNSKYIAEAAYQHIYIQELSSARHVVSIANGTFAASGHLVLALSQTRLGLLAVSKGYKTILFDTCTLEAQCTLNGTGRAITSLAFCNSSPDMIVTGSTDGSICLWSTKNPFRPLQQLRGIRQACQHIAPHPKRSDLLAVSYEDRLVVWSFSRTIPLVNVSLLSSDIKFMSWADVEDPTDIWCISCVGLVTILELSHTSIAPQARYVKVAKEESDVENISLDGLEGSDVRNSAQFQFNVNILQACLLGQTGVVVLPPQAKTLFFYAYSLHTQSLTELWRLSLDDTVECFALRKRTHFVEIHARVHGIFHVHEVPDAVVDAMAWSGEVDEVILSCESGHHFRRIHRSSPASMRAGSVLLRKPVFRHHGKIEHRDHPVSRSKRNPFSVQRLSVEHHNAQSTAGPSKINFDVGPQREKTSQNEDELIMPFLSPSIPARSVPPASLASLDGSLRLSPHALIDQKTSLATVAHDSDSDDEALDAQLSGSKTFLDGSVNVPLPRTCGASFGPNGDLVLFFPSTSNTTNESDELHKTALHESSITSTTVKGLFPGFGNMLTAAMLDGPIRTGDMSNSVAHELPVLTLQPSSFESRQSWPLKTSTLKQAFVGIPGQRVTITVRRLESLISCQRMLGEQYELICEEDADSAEICMRNASVASARGLHDAAEAWQMLALILEDSAVEVSNSSLAGNPKLAKEMSSQPLPGEPVSMVAQPDISTENIVAEPSRALRHPLGSEWALEQLFQWAERQANVQLLATMSGVLTSVRKDFRPNGESRLHKNTAPSYGTVENGSPSEISILRTNYSQNSQQSWSPIKGSNTPASHYPHIRSATSDIDSSRSTPPSTVPNLSPAASRIFVTGSSSPEHHWSSFSVNARNYAASIAEKFSSYGSSPPTRRAGISPANELSSSLPTNQPGSWSKSVSFASNIDPTKRSIRSLSLAREDDDDDDNDSDKTVDENTVVQTPKIPGTTVSFRTHDNGFFDERSSGPSMSLVPNNLSSDGQRWRKCYAEQLRSWGLLLKAAELDDVSSEDAFESLPADVSQESITLRTTARTQRSTCTVCDCVIQAAEQLCPVCLHTIHPQCLEQLVASLKDAPFSCPTGCGCECGSMFPAVLDGKNHGPLVV